MGSSQASRESPILAAKLARPHVSDDLLVRTRLLDLLSSGLDRKVILVSAQAGAGKTSLVADWLSRLEGLPEEQTTDANVHSSLEHHHASWLSLDEYDSDLVTYLTYFLAAVESLFPDATPTTRALLKESKLPPSQYLANALINELSAITEKFVLVLDDYHNVSDKVVHRFMSRLIVNVPAVMTLVVVSRRDPPIPVARLRAQQHLVELRTRDLRFSREEARAFFQHAVASNLPAGAVDGVAKRTEGWATGLRMVAVSLRQRSDEVDFLNALQSSERQVTDFLVDEVLAKLPEEIQLFLLKSSVLDRFCAPLCDALQDDDRRPGHSQQILDRLVQGNLFTRALDDEHGWYRFHELFRDLLSLRLHWKYGDKEITTLHIRASEWFRQNGYIGEAFDHAIAANATDLAADFVEEYRHGLMNREEWPTLDKLLGTLPERVIRLRPALLLARAWTYHRHLSINAVRAFLEEVERLLGEGAEALEEQEERQLRGELNALWSEQWFWRNDGRRSITYAREALELLPEEDAYARGVSLVYLASSLRLNGDDAEALRILNQALEFGAEHSGSLLIAVLGIHLINGELDELNRLANHVIRISQKERWRGTIAWAHHCLGIACYEQNDLEKAIGHFTKVVHNCQAASLSALHNSLVGLVLASQTLNRVEEADLAFEELQALATTTRNSLHLLEMRYLWARLALIRGEVGTATRSLPDGEIDHPFLAPFFLEIPPVTRARVLLAEGTDWGKLEARKIALGLLNSAEATHNTRRIIETLALLSLVEDALGRRRAALDHLRRAVTMAVHGRFVRTFVDYGRPMAGLLYALAAEGPESEYVRALISVFPREQADSGKPRVLRLPGQEIQIEPLTERETEVLVLLGWRYSNKEIAKELNISPLTVKKHASNIYRKLHVKNRRQAVTVARQLGILPPD